MLKHVAPIDPRASIPDPERGQFLPPEGRTVPWTPYWAGMAMREEITVSDAQDEPVAAAESPATVEAEPAHGAHPDA
ncbi:hypothetical protein ACLBX9_16645 [Methylobacterium sp. A49B]